MSDAKSWNSRFTVQIPGLEETKKLPKMRSYRRKNGEEVKGTISTGPKKPSGEIKSINGRGAYARRVSQKGISSVKFEDDDENMMISGSPPRNQHRELQPAYEALNIDIENNNNFDAPGVAENTGEEIQLSSSSSSPYMIKKLSHIGRGSTANVYKSFHAGKFQVVAEKLILCNNDTRKKHLVQELSTLRSLLAVSDERKQFIVGLVDVVSGGSSVSVCLEYMHASLQDIVDTGGCTVEIVLSGMVRQMLLGLSFIHEKRFLHRDFKPVDLRNM